MNKMTSAEEQDILNSLTKVVNGVRRGGTAEACLSKVATDKGYSAPIVARMCEAYNKSKTIYMLEKTGADKRADTFPLVNSKDVIRQIFGSHTDVSPSNNFPKLNNLDFEKKAACTRLEKTASEEDTLAPAERSAPLSLNSQYTSVVKMCQHEKLAMNQADQEVRMSKIKVESAVGDAASILSSYTETGLRKVAQQVFNKHGQKGQQLVNIIYAKLSKQAPTFNKTANTTIFKADEPFLSISRAMDNLRSYHNALVVKEAMQEKEAVGIMTDFLSNIAAGVAEQGLSAGEAGGSGAPLDKLVRFREQPSAKEVFDPMFSNKLGKLDNFDMFYNMYTEDEFLRKQPIEEVIKAYNNIMQAVPSIAGKSNKQAIIKSLVKKQVAEGGELEPLEVSQYLALDKLVDETSKRGIEKGKAKEERSKPSVPELPEGLKAPAKKPMTFFSDRAKDAQKARKDEDKDKDKDTDNDS